MSREEREKIFSPYAENQKILEKFQEQRAYIEKITGLTLSNIEAVGLRKITEVVMKQMMDEGIEGADGFNVADPVEEIPARFFQEFFDIPAGEFWKIFPENQPELRKEWFKREQEKRHLI